MAALTDPLVVLVGLDLEQQSTPVALRSHEAFERGRTAPNRPVLGRVGGAVFGGQDDAAASGLWVQQGPDGWVVAEVVGEALEHGEVGAADQVAVVGGDAVEGAVAQPDGAVGVVVGFVAAGGQRRVPGGRCGAGSGPRAGRSG